MFLIVSIPDLCIRPYFYASSSGRLIYLEFALAVAHYNVVFLVHGIWLLLLFCLLFVLGCFVI